MVGRIPQQFIDELMTRVDIVEIIDARVPLRKAGRDHTACCPFHEEKTPSFTVSQQKQFYHCFGCGVHGTALGFLMEYEHLDFVEAVHELASQVGLQVPQQATQETVTRPDQDLYGVLEQAASFYGRQLREHADAERAIDYLKGRGLSGEIVAHYGIGFAPPGWDNLQRALAVDRPDMQLQLAKVGMLVEKEGGGYYERFRDRIMFPIHDQRGRVIGFGGRVLGDELPKYLNSPETPLFHKGRELYGLYQARKALRSIDRLMVVEGYMDVVALAQHGIQYAAATLGTATTHEHLERIFRVAPEVIFCFDGDRAGREAAWRALENALPVMREGRQASFLFLPDGEDPDSLVRREGRVEFEARIAQATPFSSFFYESLCKKVDTSSMDGRARLVELARPLLSKLATGIFHHMMVARLAEIVRIDATELNRMLGQRTPKVRPAAAKAGRSLSEAGRAGPLKHRDQMPRLPQIRLAIALLLQQPGLASLAGTPERFREIEIPGLELLVKLLHVLQEQPQLSSGALLERWRGTDEASHLMKLAQWQHLLPEQEWETQFQAALGWLYGQGIEQRKQRLIDKSRSGEELTTEERLEMQRLFSSIAR